MTEVPGKVFIHVGGPFQMVPASFLTPSPPGHGLRRHDRRRTFRQRGDFNR